MFLPLELVYDHELNIANYGYHRQMHLARVVSLPDFSILLLQAIVQSVKKAKIRGENAYLDTCNKTCKIIAI